MTSPQQSSPQHSSPQQSSPQQSSTTRLLVITATLAIAAGVVVAALLLLATGRGDTPRGPFALGSARGLREEVRKSPVYIADPTGGQGLWLALRGGDLVALAAVPPGNSTECAVRWRDSVKAYEDCDGERYDGEELDEYRLELRRGSLYVDTRRLVPAGSTDVGTSGGGTSRN